MLTAYITHPACERHEMGADHPECPERLGAIQDHLLIKGLMDAMQPHTAPAATHEQLLRVHTAQWLDRLRAMMSTVLPAEKTAIRRIGRLGQACATAAQLSTSSRGAATARSRDARRGISVSLSSHREARESPASQWSHSS